MWWPLKLTNTKKNHLHFHVFYLFRNVDDSENLCKWEKYRAKLWIFEQAEPRIRREKNLRISKEEKFWNPRISGISDTKQNLGISVRVVFGKQNSRLPQRRVLLPKIEAKKYFQETSTTTLEVENSKKIEPSRQGYGGHSLFPQIKYFSFFRSISFDLTLAINHSEVLSPFASQDGLWFSEPWRHAAKFLSQAALAISACTFNEPANQRNCSNMWSSTSLQNGHVQQSSTRLRTHFFFAETPRRGRRRLRRPFARGRPRRVLQSVEDSPSSVVWRASSTRSGGGICRGHPLRAGEGAPNPQVRAIFLFTYTWIPCFGFIPTLTHMQGDEAWRERGGGSDARSAQGRCDEGEEGCGCAGTEGGGRGKGGGSGRVKEDGADDGQGDGSVGGNEDAAGRGNRDGTGSDAPTVGRYRRRLPIPCLLHRCFHLLFAVISSHEWRIVDPKHWW
jgi:hypothetical protein